MIYIDKNNYDERLYENLKIDCGKCFGLCCVGLFFSASDGFPTDKEAGKPCTNLQSDFRCAIHERLMDKGLKGCNAYDCFGAGQKVAQVTYGGQDWRQNKKSSKQMFEVFLIMRQLHEMLWYLTKAATLQTNNILQDKLQNIIGETEELTKLDAASLIALNLEVHRANVNALLRQTSEIIRSKAIIGQKTNLKRHKTIAGRLDFMGADLRKTNLRGADLRGAFLIAADLSNIDLSGADLIGADLRDADIRGANLENSLFITQFQINTARGDSKTKLPMELNPPANWNK